MLAHADIRLATPEDAAAIAAMSREYIEVGLPWGWRPERIARAIRDPDTNVAVAGPTGALGAFGIMSYRNEDAHLLLFAVHHERRRQGLGSALLAWLEDVARTAGARRICLEARWDNVAGRSFYSEHGYHEREIQGSRYGRHVAGVRLEKWLRPASPP
jgi:ribosomal-protein-alanine N-acetyltransferase